MVNHPTTRRQALFGITALCSLPMALRAENITDIEWSDLLPQGDTSLPSALQGVVRHEDAPLASQQPASTGVRTDWNGRTVRLSGFVLPLDYGGTGLRVFMLVPYVGACIHVPPPPANQLVLVMTKRPYEAGGLFDPITVTGVLGTTTTETEMAVVGYTMNEGTVVPYRG